MAGSILPLAALLLSLQAPPADTVTLVIAATTDVHGRLLSWDYERGREAPLGLVRAATAVDSLRRVHGRDRVILVDAGDLLQGNGFAAYFVERRGMAVHPIIDAMNRMGYEAATPGNHEFNFGVDALWRMRRGARFPYVSANIEGAPGRQVGGAVTLERAGVRVAITGVTTPGVMVWDGDKVRGRISVRNMLDAAPAALAALAREADVTVLLAHAGLDGPSSYAESAAAPPENAVAAVIAAAPRTDLVVIGHTHREIADTTIGATLVVQPGAWARSLAVAELTLRREGGRWRVAGKRGTLVRLDRVAPDSALTARFAPAHRAALRAADAPVGAASAVMSGARARLEDTPLVDFINAVMRRASGAELSATAAFDPRATIPAGPVRLHDLAAVYPYENTLRAVQLSGADLRAYLEHAARYYRGIGPDGQPVVNDSVPGYNFDIVSGAEYELDLARPLGERVVALRVHGRDVAPADSFTMALSDYRQQGGGGFPAVAAAPVVFRSDSTIRDLLVAEFRRRGTIQPEEDFARSWSIRGVAVNGAGGHGGTDTIVLRVLTTNDLHGRLTARPESWSNRRPVGGAAHIAGMMNRLEAECGCPTLRLDGGDVMQGTPVSNLTYGRATVDALNAMGYHAAAIGNHEFDWTVDTLAARIRQARFAWLSANIVETGPGSTRAPRRPPWATPWRMVTVGPLRVALIGYTSPGTTTSTNPRNIARLGFRGAVVVDSLVGVARAQRADFVIVLAHEGAFCDRDNACRGAVVDLAMDLTAPHKPDLIVSGHTHSLVTTEVNGIPIVQARSGGTALGIVDLPAAGAGRAPRVRVATVWADREAPDTAVARVVVAHEAAVESLAQRPVVVLAERIARDSGLGDMVAEANRLAAQADVGLVNATGVRRSLEAGPARWGDVFEVLPFGNYVLRLTIDGRSLRSLARHVVGRGDHFAGLTVTLDPSRPAGERITDLTLADGRVVSDTARYTLGVLDFLANGGSGYGMLTGLPSTNTGVTDLDAFIQYLRSRPQPVRTPRRGEMAR